VTDRNRWFLLRNIKLFWCYVEILHDFGYNFASAIATLHLLGWPFFTVKLKIIFDPFENRKIELLFDNFSLDDCVRLERLVFID